MRVRVRDGLAALPPGVEHDPVTAAFDPLGGGDLVSLADKLVEQTPARFGQRRHVRVVIAGDHQDMGGRLRADVAEGQGPPSVEHDRGRDVSGGDPAKQAVRHISIIVARRRLLVPHLTPAGLAPARNIGPRDLLSALLPGLPPATVRHWPHPPAGGGQFASIAAIGAERTPLLVNN
jgi:hypothetical protein